MTLDPKLLRWLNFLGMVVVGSLVAFIGFVTWRINDSSQSRSVAPDLTEFRGYVRKARLAASEGRLREAEQNYVEALRLFPRSSSVNLEFAKYYEDHGQLPKAVAQYERVVGPAIKAVETHRTSPVDTSILVHYGDLCLRSGNAARARAIFAAVSNNPSTVPLNDLRAGSYTRVGRYAEAIKLNPRLWEAYRTAAFSRSADESRKWLGRFAGLLKRYPDDPSGHSVYADTIWALGRPKEALAYLQSASRRVSVAHRGSFERQMAVIRNQMQMEARLRARDIAAAGAKLPPGAGFSGPSGGMAGGTGGPTMPAGSPGMPPRR